MVCSLTLLSTTTLPAAFSATSVSATRSDRSRLHQGEMLLAGQLRFTVRGVGTSRDRVSGIARGSSRGACTLDETAVSLTALAPNYESATPTSSLPVESTLSSHPAFFAYIPQTQAEVAQFILSDENQNTIYQTTLTPPSQSGVIGVQIPQEVPALQIGNTYHWMFILQCDPFDRSADALVEGWVQRAELTPAQVNFLERTAPRDRPAFFARAGIWQDTLTSLATLRLSNPNDAALTSDWVSLLESVNLAPVATAPLINVNLATQPATATCRCNP
jgi:hypothetical protein